MKRLASALTILTSLAISSFAQDTIAPTTFSATLPVGGSTSVNKVVTVGKVVTPIDILFLVDATGSMGPAISNVNAGFMTIQNAITGSATDVQFGVANYLDQFNCGSDPYAYKLNQDLTSNMAAVNGALGAISAGGGCDLPESNLFGLQQAALTTSWRPGSARFIVWVGDAPGHDPAGTATEASAILALKAAGVRVFAASANSGPGLDSACGDAPCGTPNNNQAVRIAAATGGQDIGMFAPSGLTNAIMTAITNAIGTYSTVSLGVSPVPAGVTITITPASITGSFNRSTARTFNFTVTFTGTVPGAYNFGINALVDGKAVATETDAILVPSPLSISKAFSPNKIVPGGTSTLTLTITNPNGVAAGGAGVVDTLPAGVTVSTPNALNNTCGGTVTAVAGSGTITLAGGSVAASASCTVVVNVTSNEGIKVNTTNAVTSNFGAGNTATATLSVASPPSLTKAFGAVSIVPNGSTSLTLTLNNPNTTVGLTGIAFSDTLPAGLTVSAPNPPNVIGGTCVGAITAPPGSNLVSVSAVSLAAGTTCTITLNVTAAASAVGLLTNTTSTVTSVQAPPGSPASATLFVGEPYQVSYFPNLNIGDSVINISNAGSMGGVTLQSGTSASVGGSLCANVYSFTPDEQVVSCCSCPVTPNGLASFSLKNDIVANRLTGQVPTSTVVKLLATVPVGGTCNNSAASTTAGLAAGMVAWGTKLHAAAGSSSGGAQGGGGGSNYEVTEVPFTSSSLSASELNRLRSLCAFIQAQGSGTGVCSSCRSTGLGADKQ